MLQTWEIKLIGGEYAVVTADSMQTLSGMLIFSKKNIGIAAFPINQIVYAIEKNEVKIIDKN